jgi:uncharacterized membrane protein
VQDGRVVTLHVENDVDAPADAVYAYVSEWSNAPRFVSGLKSWTQTTEGDAAVGTRFVVEIGAAMGTVSGELEIVRLDPGRAIGWKSHSGPNQTGLWTFTPVTDTTCRVRFELGYTPRLSGPLARVFNKSVESVIQGMLTQSGKKLREQVEQPATAS